jgi:hypothetical protein
MKTSTQARVMLGAVIALTCVTWLAGQDGGFGTANTLYTMPEAGQGGGAGDPTAEQLAASPEAQAIIANTKRMAGADLGADVNRFCTWNAGATVSPMGPGETVQMFDNLYYSTTGRFQSHP